MCRADARALRDERRRETKRLRAAGAGDAGCPVCPAAEIIRRAYLDPGTTIALRAETHGVLHARAHEAKCSASTRIRAARFEGRLRRLTKRREA